MADRRRGGLIVGLVVALVASTLATSTWKPGTASAATAPSHTYTTSLDFSAGSSINVVDVVPDQLQLDDTTRAFGFIWVALSNRGTVAKIDTATGQVLGEYRTAPDGRGKDPSRTTVDQDGNVWVGNRAEGGGGRGSVVHLGLEENGQCVDRNGNGQIDTSRGLGDIRDWPRAGDADWNGGVTQAQDECIVHYVRTAGTEIRHVSVTPDNDVWVGGPRTNRGKLELLDAEGTSLRVIDMALPADTGETGRVTCCYGGLVDAHGVLWSATAGGTLVRLDPSFPNGHPDLVTVVPVRYSYGLGRDLDGNIWASNWTADGVDKVAPDGTHLARYATTSGSNDRGVVASADGDIWVANSGRHRVTRFGSDGVIKAVIPVGTEPTGVSVASDGKVWVTNLRSHDLSRIDPATNTVDLTLDLRYPGLANPGPYNYSDMTGSTLTGRPDRGTWSVVHDSGEAAAEWPQLNWTAEVPGDGSVRVFVASSEDGTTFGPTVEVDAGEVPAVSPGRHLRIEVRFVRAGSGETPVLHDLSIGATNEPPVADAGGDREVVEGGVVTLDGTASHDPDDDELTYRWELVGSSGPPVTLTSTTGPAVSFAAPDDGSYTFDLTVSDGEESSTDRVTVQVVNAAPEAQGRLDVAAAGGVSLLSGSFTDVGYFDTHAAVVDWGDGTPAETLPVAAQGTGWGTVVASHVYVDPGSYVVTLTVRDDDGGESTVTLEQISVVAPTAIWAGSDSATNGLWVSGASVFVDGATHSNRDIRVNGAAKTFTGPTTYVRNLTVNGNHTFDPAATSSPTQDAPPVPFTIDDYRPGARAALAVGDAYHDMTGACAAGGNKGWRPAGPLEAGLYFVPCDVSLKGALSTGPITVASTGTISSNGGTRDFFAPYVDGVLFVSGRVGGKGIDIAGAGSHFAGYLLAPTSGLEVNGADHRFTCGLVADTVRIAGARAQVRASDCAPPSNTSPDPTLVPRLTVGLAQTPAEVLPGDRLDDAVTVTNDGASLLVPTVVGAENVGADPARLAGVTLVVEARSAIDGSWAPVPGAIEMTARPNPHPGATYGPGPDPFAGTEVEAGSLATWSVELQVALDPDTAAALVDPARTAAVRVRMDLTTDPADAAIRPLWRFGDDLAPALAGAGADLTDVAVTLVAPDGAVLTFDQASNPELGALAPGAGTSLAASTDVAVPGPVQTGESTEAYLARLRSLDGTSLAAASHARASGGVGLVLAPQQVATSVRRLPVVGQRLNGPLSAPVGTDVAYDLGLVNTGSAPAGTVTTEASIDAVAVPVDGLPTELPAGGLASGAIEHRIPDDHPGGILAVRSLLGWSDANGNEYGPVRAERDTSVAGTPVVTATLVDALAVDADGTGQPSPGDTVAYTARITNTSGNAVTSAGFALTPDPHTALLVGSVATGAGAVTRGNAPGDTEVVVDLGTLAPLSTVEVTFSVVIADPVPEELRQISVQGTVTGDLLVEVRTDDPATFGPQDPTATRVFRAEAALGSTLTARLAVDRDGNGVVSPGDTLAYEASVDQLGNTVLDGVSFTLTPDPNTVLVSGSVMTDRGTVVAGNGGEGTVAVDLGTLPIFTGAEVGFEVLVTSPFPAGVSAVSAQATVTSTQTDPVLSDDPTTEVPGDATTTAVSVGGGIGEPIQTGPTVGDCSLEDGASVTAPTTITCTLTPRDGTVVEDWIVSLRPAEGGTAEETVPLGSGVGETVSVEIDPTLLPNGLWTVVINTTDDGGGTTVDERAIVVEGNLKLGRYSVTYQDMAVPVGGIPIQVLRTYDTLDRNTVGDFGHGWNLELANFRVQTNGPLGARGWEQYGCGGGMIFANLCYRTNRSHLVTVTWPDGRVETFDFTPKGLNTFFSVGAIPGYTGRGGATSRLEPAPGDTSAGWRGDGNIYRGGFAEGPVYDPSRFVLVGRDGTRYLLDEHDGLVEIRDRFGRGWRVTADGVIGDDGVAALDLTRDGDGRIVSADSIAGTATYSYDSSGDLAVAHLPGGAEAGYRYVDHLLTERLDPGTSTPVVLEYDDDGRLEAVVEPGDLRTTVTIAMGERREVTVAPGARLVTDASFDVRGNPDVITEVVDGDARTRSYEFDGFDRMTSYTDPLGNTGSATYGPHGNIASITDAAGQQWSYSWDGHGLLTAVSGPTGEVMSIERDDLGRPTRMTTLGRTSHLGDFVGGNPSTIVHPGGATSGLIWSEGNLTSVSGPGGSLEYSYSPTGAITSVTGGGQVIEFGHGVDDTLTSVTDSLNRTWSFGRDRMGNLTSEVDPVDGTATYSYDDRQLLRSIESKRGEVISISYDELGNRSGMIAASGEWMLERHDGLGRLVRSENADAVVEIDYDANDQVVAVRTTPTEPGAGVSVVTHGYDPLGNRVSTTTEAGTVRYDYDSLGRVTRVHDIDGGVFELDHGDDDQLDRIKRPNGVTTTVERDVANRVTAVVHRDASEIEIDGVRLEYDPTTGLLTARSDAVGRHVYSYDAAGRLTGVAGPAPLLNWSYSYDAVGNRTDGGATYDAANRLLEDDEYRYEHDADGRMTERVSKSTGASLSYAWDGFDRLRKVIDEDGSVSTMSYDPLGRRIGWQGEDDITYEYGVDDNPVRIGSAEGSVDVTFGPALDSLLAIHGEADTSFPLLDPFGSVTAASDDGGALTGRQHFGPFGEDAGGDALGPFGFQGREDAPGELLHFRARPYSPQLGRFIAEDPAGSVVNRYGFELNNPFAFTDPTGEINVISYPSLLDVGTDFLFSALDLLVGSTIEERVHFGVNKVVGYGSGNVARAACKAMTTTSGKVVAPKGRLGCAVGWGMVTGVMSGLALHSAAAAMMGEEITAPKMGGWILDSALTGALSGSMYQAWGKGLIMRLGGRADGYEGFGKLLARPWWF